MITYNEMYNAGFFHEDKVLLNLQVNEQLAKTTSHE